MRGPLLPRQRRKPRVAQGPNGGRSKGQADAPDLLVRDALHSLHEDVAHRQRRWLWRGGTRGPQPRAAFVHAQQHRHVQPCRLGGARGHGLERRFAALPTRPMPKPVVVHRLLRCRSELRNVQRREAPACDIGRFGRGLLLHLGLRGLLLCPLLFRRRPRRGLSRLLLERLHAQQHGARLRRRLRQKILLARSLRRDRRECLGRGLALARRRWRCDGHPLGAQRLRWQGVGEQLCRLRQQLLGRWRRVCRGGTRRCAGSRGGVAAPPQRRSARQVVGRRGRRRHAHRKQGIEMSLGSDELTARDAAQVPPIVPDVIQ
mmetsp:Transcript_46628/g.151347  ORF Transcript_46628/g.151347 Transcript_46628/m.151347 type:complete len:317 (+) Transcript_46628:1055-2005(+)